jgi:hypothetical protein
MMARDPQTLRGANAVFFSELKRPNALRVDALYIGTARALSQALAQLPPVFDAKLN